MSVYSSECKTEAKTVFAAVAWLHTALAAPCFSFPFISFVSLRDLWSIVAIRALPKEIENQGGMDVLMRGRKSTSGQPRAGYRPSAKPTETAEQKAQRYMQRPDVVEMVKEIQTPGTQLHQVIAHARKVGRREVKRGAQGDDGGKGRFQHMCR